MATIQATQTQKQVEITTSLGRDVLLFSKMRATEALGRLFELQLDLLSENPNIKFEDLLGQKITIRLELPHGKKRYFSGHVTSFSQLGTRANLFIYHAVVHPWLWLLTRRANCRIFQDKTIPDIIKDIFRDHGFTDYEEALSGRYQPWEYCVQYRETDFNFVSRLMEQQGIYYYFKHENDKHTLVLSDSVSAHQPFPGYDRVPYFPLEENLRRERDHIYAWSVSQEVQTGTYALNDFDFKRPKANLQVKSAITRPHAASQMEVYDYPGKYFQTDEGEAYARARIEELQSEYEHLHGEGNARGLSVGNLFNLTGFTRQDQNREYLIVSATHELISDHYETQADAGHAPADIYQCKFTAIPSQQPFRPARTTYRPIVQGPQTAIVVGPSGSEIYTDKYSRVKVQFHWDRYGKYDQNSSCWVRVSQVWAGAKWGAIHIPRIGQEVLVDFLEGDPDRPIITGRVYNNDNMPPYELPANATQSGIKTRSSKGGSPGNINELRFEDKKGQEMIFLQAEKDHETRVKNDFVKLVENESHLIVKSNQIELVKGNKYNKVKGDLCEKIDGGVMTTVGTDMLQKVGGRFAMKTGSEIHLKAGMNVVIEAGMSITLKAGSGFVMIGPSGVIISGTPVLINSGGSAGSGSGCSPDSPKDPREPGKSSEVQKETLPPPPATPPPMSKAFRSAAVAGAPFCEPEEWD